MMSRFLFPLQPLLEARIRAEARHQRVVAAIDRERMALEMRIRAQQQLILDTRRSVAGILVGRVDVALLRGEGAVTLRAMRSAQRLVLELAGVHKRLERARRELVEATKRKRAVEILRERRFNEWKASLNKAETNALDELAIQRFGLRETLP